MNLLLLDEIGEAGGFDRTDLADRRRCALPGMSPNWLNDWIWFNVETEFLLTS